MRAARSSAELQPSRESLLSQRFSGIFRKPALLRRPRSEQDSLGPSALVNNRQHRCFGRAIAVRLLYDPLAMLLPDLATEKKELRQFLAPMQNVARCCRDDCSRRHGR